MVDRQFDEIFQFAADMGGAGYIFTGENDAKIMRNSALININVLSACKRQQSKIFFTHHACIYPRENQTDTNNRIVKRDLPILPIQTLIMAGKNYSVSGCMAHAKMRGFEFALVVITIFLAQRVPGEGGREKAPAAICRKIAAATNNSRIKIWGDGQQTRSFLHISECIEGTLKVMRSKHAVPLNIGSDEIVSINELVSIVANVAGKKIDIEHEPGPQGVRGRQSDNTLIAALIGWRPSKSMAEGIAITYPWIEQQLYEKNR